jgi:hypothetical protein
VTIASLHWFDSSYGITFPETHTWWRSDQHILKLRRQGFLTFADILWTDGGSLVFPTYQQMAYNPDAPLHHHIQFPAGVSRSIFGVAQILSKRTFFFWIASHWTAYLQLLPHCLQQRLL